MAVVVAAAALRFDCGGDRPRLAGGLEFGGLFLVVGLMAGCTAAARADEVPAVECRPRATFLEINAAIGGTGSDLGAFRVGQDVIAHAPDLVFIEFAVNDGVHPLVETGHMLYAEALARALIDSYCTGWRLATLSLGDLAPGEHTIEITLTDERLDKQSILFEKNRGDVVTNPDKYTPHVWYASAALVFGDASTGQEPGLRHKEKPE